MSLASNADNIRFNGTGRLYAANVGSPNIGIEIGEIDGLSDSYSTSEDKITSNRTAGKVTLKTVKNETEMTVAFGMREQSIENLELAYSANTHSVTSQAAGTLNMVATAVTAKEYVDLGKLDLTIVKLGYGVVTGGPFEIGETITGGTSSAAGDVVWVGNGYVELIDVSGTFSSGETVTGSTSSASAAVSSVETKQDYVVADAAIPTTRYVQGIDYQVDAAYGYLMKLPGGAMGDTVYVGADHPAKSIDTIHALSGGDVEKKLTFVSDEGDLGPRQRFTYNRVKMSLNGDNQKIGDGESVLPMTGTVLADTSKPIDEQYVKIETM